MVISGGVMKGEVVSCIVDELQEGSGVAIKKLEYYFGELNSDSFVDLVKEINDSDDKDLIGQFIYYLTLFRKSDKVDNLLKDSDLPLNMVEYLLISSFTRAAFDNESEEEVLDKLLLNFKQEVYLDLLIHSKYVSKDRMLTYYVATKLDRHNLDRFFNSLDDVYAFVEGVMRVPAKTRKMLFSRNMEFYSYVSMFCSSVPIDIDAGFSCNSEGAALLDLDLLHQNKQIIMNVAEKFNLEKEKKVSLQGREKERIAFIVREAKKSQNSNELITAMFREGVIIDEEEKSLILEILHNPIMKNILKKYSDEEYI